MSPYEKVKTARLGNVSIFSSGVSYNQSKLFPAVLDLLNSNYILYL
jgi:hypothetical protein